MDPVTVDSPLITGKIHAHNAIPDTDHNANPTNPNRYSKGNLTLPTLLTLILDTVVNKAPTYTSMCMYFSCD